MQKLTRPCYIIEIQNSDEVYYFADEKSARFFQPRRAVYNMLMGSQPNDGGNFFMTEAERDDVLAKEPGLAKFIRQVKGSAEFIRNIKRYCFWFVDATPAEIRHSKILYERVKKVKEFLLASKREATQKKADSPALFTEIRQPTSEYLLIPRHSSERRFYIPMGYEPPEVIVTDAAFALPNATPYHLGLLSSSVHMAWMRVVWPSADPVQVMNIERTGRAILAARANYPDSSYADMYDEITMPQDLRKAHKENDSAVLEAYGLPQNIDEYGIVSKLMELYNAKLAEIDARKSK